MFLESGDKNKFNSLNRIKKLPLVGQNSWILAFSLNHPRVFLYCGFTIITLFNRFALSLFSVFAESFSGLWIGRSRSRRLLLFCLTENLNLCKLYFPAYLLCPVLLLILFPSLPIPAGGRCCSLPASPATSMSKAN